MNAREVPVEVYEEGALEEAEALQPGWQLKKLSPRHRQAMSLIAQGLDRGTVATIVGYTPEYITMLLAQPLCKAFYQTMSAAADQHMEALTARSVEVVAEVLQRGTPEDQLKAARLQLEATKRVGRASESRGQAPASDERLIELAHRLTDLLQQSRAAAGVVIEGERIAEGGSQT